MIEIIRKNLKRTLNVTDKYSSWTEFTCLLNDAYSWTLNGLKEINNKLPFKLNQLDSDNGSEIINNLIYNWCIDNSIKFTRSRPYQKNDNAHIEQKKWCDY